MQSGKHRLPRSNGRKELELVFNINNKNKVVDGWGSGGVGWDEKVLDGIGASELDLRQA